MPKQLHFREENPAKYCLRLHVLASGSKGNCSVVENSATGQLVLIDCGISFKAFKERCNDLGIDPLQIDAILVTHDHSDHTKGLGVLTRGLAKLNVYPTLYCSQAVHKASADICAIQDTVDLQYFKAEEELGLGSMQAYTFHTSHDAAESFGFRFQAGQDALGFMTDTGVALPCAEEALTECRILAIEANHDVDMLAKGPYPGYLKARVGGKTGHLSNEQSGELLERLLNNSLECVVGMHISQNNNNYRLPKQTLATVLKNNCHSAQALVGYQERPLSV